MRTMTYLEPYPQEKIIPAPALHSYQVLLAPNISLHAAKQCNKRAKILLITNCKNTIAHSLTKQEQDKFCSVER